MLNSSIWTAVWALLPNSSITTGTGALLFTSSITYLSINFILLKHCTYTWVIMRVLEFSAVSTAILEYSPAVLSTTQLALMCILQHCSPSAPYFHLEHCIYTRLSMRNLEVTTNISVLERVLRHWSIGIGVLAVMLEKKWKHAEVLDKRSSIVAILDQCLSIHNKLECCGDTCAPHESLEH